MPMWRSSSPPCWKAFYQEAHAHEFGTGTIYQFEYALGGIAIGQKIVDEEYFVALAQVVAAHAHIVRALLGKREYLGGKHMLHGAGSLFLANTTGSSSR